MVEFTMPGADTGTTRIVCAGDVNPAKLASPLYCAVIAC
jgi:hypothetical protein